MKILLADDNRDIIHLARKRLEKDGHDVFSTINGAEVLDIAKTADIDIMALNINLPHLRWNKISKAIKEKNHSPVIFILPEDLKREIIPSETNIHYIKKPFHPDELYNSIRMAIQIKRLHTELKDKEEEIKKEAVFDNVIGLYNRQYLMKRLLEEISKARRYKYSLSLLVCEINQPKPILPLNVKAKYDKEDCLLNDSTIKAGSRIIKECIRKGDIIAKYNNNKLIVLLPHTFSDGAITCAEKIIKRITDYNQNASERLLVNIGSSSFPINAKDDQELLINRAITALRKAKRVGDNRAIAV
ncbi:MAG: diguanylate cyclase [Nitrospirae bacterium]|nr:diguanylate cyclase [Nitrospirota bacterium]